MGGNLSNDGEALNGADGRHRPYGQLQGVRVRVSGHDVWPQECGNARELCVRGEDLTST